MGQPPNALANLLNVYFCWQTYTVTINLDLTKAYQSIATGQVEQNVRLVGRRGDPETPWMIYGLMVMTFGDQFSCTDP